jgi:hypothetical protein
LFGKYQSEKSDQFFKEELCLSTTLLTINVPSSNIKKKKMTAAHNLPKGLFEKEYSESKNRDLFTL